MNEENEDLFEKLDVFLNESIDLLKKEVDLTKIPPLENSRVRYDETSNKIIKQNSPNWYQIKIPEKIFQLNSYFEVINSLKLHSVIFNQNEKTAYAFGNGTQFNILLFPIEFLKRLIFEENKLEFNSGTSNIIFELFLNFIDPEKQDFSRIIVPFDDFLVSENPVEIENGLRIRMLDGKEIVDLINHNSMLHHYYGTMGYFWFKCILEIDLPFKWFWSNPQKSGNVDENDFLQMYNPIAYMNIERRINQEIIILRTICNRPITSPTFIVDYRGWREGSMVWTYRYLPWRRFPFSFSPLVDISKYPEYRKKMDSIEKKYRQRIFVAMRKFAYSLEKIYPGDQLVDTVSGLEGLVLGASEPEISHKFAERVCLMLESDPEKRLQLLTDMKRAYGLRSSVAHGSAVIDNFDIFWKFEKIEEGERAEFKKTQDLNRRSQKLRGITREKLQKAIFLCLDRQSTDFNWDEIIMGTTIKP